MQADWIPIVKAISVILNIQEKDCEKRFQYSAWKPPEKVTKKMDLHHLGVVKE